MAILNLFRAIDRKRWFVCYDCMMHSAHDPLKSVFYSDAAPEDYLGRPMIRCPRCRSVNTRSFQDMKDKQEKAALWGLERIVKSHPRSVFAVKSAGEAKTAT